MYYQDLSYYRVGASEKPFQYVFPEVKCVGWLGADVPYPKGAISDSLTKKLKEMLFLDIKNSEDKKNGCFDESKAVQVHNMYVRGIAQPCPFCKNTITVKPTNLQYYQGSSEKLLGQNQLCLPAIKAKEFYASPTLIYHYIEQHSYKPPQEFLDALAAFDLDKPFNEDKAQSNLTSLRVPTDEVDTLHLQPIPEDGYHKG